MSCDEQRGTDARMQHPPNRSARHRLNSLVKGSEGFHELWSEGKIA